MLNTVVPSQGRALTIGQAYFDESESNRYGVFCVCGYLFEKYQCDELEVEWNQLLETYNLPYFHMVDCAHGNKSFAPFDKPEREKIQRRFFQVLESRASYGVCISFDVAFSHLCPSAYHHGFEIVSPYSLCCYFALLTVCARAKKSGSFNEIKYFFEAGHSKQAESGKIMQDIFNSEWQRKHFMYGSHAFISKKNAAAIQCADILAWLWRKDRENVAANISRSREDLISLLKIPTDCIHFDERALKELRETVRQSNEQTRA